MSEPNNKQRVPRLSSKPLEEASAPRVIPASPRNSAQPASATKKKNGGISAIVFRISSAVFCISLVVLGFIGFNYWQGQNKYNNTTDLYFPTTDLSLLSLDEIHLNWDALRSTNSETVAWIYIPGTNVNYPIVQAEDNNKYIKTDFYGETNWAVSYGAVFLDCDCEPDMSCQNNYFYGHNMNNGYMFHDIALMDKDNTFNDHRTVYLFTPQGNYRLTSFALLHVGAFDDLVQPMPGPDGEQLEYLEEQVARSVVTPSGKLPALSEIDKTFVFITCDNEATDGRYALFCYVSDTTAKGVAKLESNSVITYDDIQNIEGNAFAAATGESTDPEEAY